MEVSVPITPGSFTPGKMPRCSLNRGLDGPQSHSGRFGEDKNLLLVLVIELLTAQLVT
jgi:hypothetical protein